MADKDDDDHIDGGSISEAEQKAALARLQALMDSKGPETTASGGRRGALIAPRTKGGSSQNTTSK
jgi:hypothetical protein